MAFGRNFASHNFLALFFQMIVIINFNITFYSFSSNSYDPLSIESARIWVAPKRHRLKYRLFFFNFDRLSIFRKAGSSPRRVWFGGARDTREPRVTIGDCFLWETPSQTSPLFKILVVNKLNNSRMKTNCFRKQTVTTAWWSFRFWVEWL